MIDWVPCQNYNRGVIVQPDTQVTFGLLNDTSWSSDIEVIGDIEHEDQQYTVKRIVGYWTITANDPQPDRGSVMVRCWPGFQEQDTQSLVVAGLVGTVAGATADDIGRSANEKWWWERIRYHSGIAETPWHECDPVTIPWHNFADFKPNYYCGTGETPAVSIANLTPQNIFFQHRWRMLVTRKG